MFLPRFPGREGLSLLTKNPNIFGRASFVALSTGPVIPSILAVTAPTQQPSPVRNGAEPLGCCQ